MFNSALQIRIVRNNGYRTPGSPSIHETYSTSSKNIPADDEIELDDGMIFGFDGTGIASNRMD